MFGLIVFGSLIGSGLLAMFWGDGSRYQKTYTPEELVEMQVRWEKYQQEKERVECGLCGSVLH